MVERTAMAPPMRDTREWQMARPRPVPPYLRHVLSSAWGERRGEGGREGGREGQGENDRVRSTSACFSHTLNHSHNKS